jgi:hypothetical protein
MFTTPAADQIAPGVRKARMGKREVTVTPDPPSAKPLWCNALAQTSPFRRGNETMRVDPLLPRAEKLTIVPYQLGDTKIAETQPDESKTQHEECGKKAQPNGAKEAVSKPTFLSARLTGAKSSHWRELVFRDYDLASRFAGWARRQHDPTLSDRSFNYPECYPNGASLVPFRKTEDDCEPPQSSSEPSGQAKNE